MIHLGTIRSLLRKGGKQKRPATVREELKRRVVSAFLNRANLGLVPIRGITGSAVSPRKEVLRTPGGKGHGLQLGQRRMGRR